jgi:hypothetical protein
MKIDPEIDIQKLWREQPQKEEVMALHEIRLRAQRFESKVHRWNLAAGVLFLILFAKNGWEMWAQDDTLERIGDLLILAALAYVAYRYRHYGRVPSMPASLGSSSCVDFYRTQLVRQREMSSGSWRFLLPFAPGLVLIIAGRFLESRSATQVVALSVLAVLLFVGCAWTNARGVRKLQKEIDTLEGL